MLLYIGLLFYKDIIFKGAKRMKFKQWLSDFKKLYLEHKKISIPLTALFLALVITFGCVLPIFVWGKKDNGNGNNNNPGGTIIGGDANGNTEYTVKVETVGGMPLEGVTVKDTAYVPYLRKPTKTVLQNSHLRPLTLTPFRLTVCPRATT